MRTAFAIRCTTALIVALALLLTGCGEGDSAAEEGQPADKGARVQLKINQLGKAKYIARVNFFCDESWARMLQDFAHRYRAVSNAYRNGQWTGAAVGKRFQSASRNTFLAGLQAQFDDVQYLGAPAGQKSRVEKMLRALQEAIYAGWERRIRSAKQFMDLFSQFNWLAYHYGVNSCLVYESNFREDPSTRRRI